MKHSVICLVMVCFFTMGTIQPFVNANAADLWNSKSHEKKSGKTYYNKRKSGRATDGVLYNRKSNKKHHRSRGGLLSSVTHKSVTMSGQKHSKLWDVMSPSAIRNRQADIDLARQYEYDRRTNTLKNVRKSSAINSLIALKNKRKYNALRARYKLDKEAKKLQRLAKRQRHFEKWRALKQRQNRSNVNVVKKKRTIIKKPKKLFNERN